jgi:excisionase family DNA binding protein
MEAVLYSKEDTARLLSVSLRTVNNLISRGDLSIHRIGRRVLISRTAIDSFVRKSSRSGGGGTGV